MFDYATLFSIVNIGIAFILITLSAIILKINRKKFAFGIALSVIYTGFTIYYLCLVSFYPHSILKEKVVTSNTPLNTASQEKNIKEDTDFTVIITTENNTFSLAPDGELDIKKGTRFKIEKVVYPSGNPDEIKADIKGFAGNVRSNDLQDIGYWVTYDDMLKHWAVKEDKDKFEIQIKKGEELLGKVYIKFID